VWNPHHPLHAEFERIAGDPALGDPIVFLGNLADARRAALARRADTAAPAN